ncbi:alpha-amylase family protein [Siphonobacter sp. SORGH_AS_1065]|uniref:alpha-amylase family protein n=1 Tax=Siphonobacter sp. SORGH_AS_1065 TaxID=3041795 RepID=UPI00278232D2|nr:alpha-amylase family protein [Siphonobacter sp. SORGH_AS_1065]MDQ1088523.1 maltose alpha-D-glucosyltransferase/alpha-amylase [Siphonobacter sp. SORGH_AS_1065]
MKKWIVLLSVLSRTLAFSQSEPSAPPAPLPTDFMQELWYKKALIYNLDVKVFKDSDGNGFGDFKGLTQQLDYLKSLGVNVVWLAPFHPSPLEDDGYDIADYYKIDPRVGTEEDFKQCIQEAKKRDIRIITDLVINHTSIQHPWYQSARKDKNSPYRNWYVWSKERPKDADDGMVFPGVQKETWTYDSLAQEYYFHRFYDFQPDLNAQNPEVETEIRKIVKHWLDLGIAGFRLDAVPFYMEIPKTNIKNPTLQFDLLYQLRQFIQWQNGQAVLLGEANVDPKETEKFIGKYGEGIQMIFNFYANQYLFAALATENTEKFIKALVDTRQIAPTSQWAWFLRNHDEIDLGRLSNEDREKVYARFGPQKNMQLYDRGIRRRLAPMLHDRKHIDLAYSLLFSLPGTPSLRYGEEIGMGDDLSLKERNSVRTPMQWSTAKNAGFSTSNQPFHPVINQGEYGYQKVNVSAQEKDPKSLLNHVKKLVKLREECPEIALGEWTILPASTDQVLVMKYDWKGKSVIVAHNFSKDKKSITLGLSEWKGKKLQNLMSNASVASTSNDTYPVTLEGYGYQWYRLN